MKTTMTRRWTGLAVMLLAVGLLTGKASAGSAWVYSPTNVTGLTLWVDASDVHNTGVNPVNGTTLATWTNKVGSFHATQSNNSLRPVITSGVQNGLDVVRFTRPAANTARYLEFNNAAIATLLNQTNTAIVVARANNGGGDNNTQKSMYVFARPGWHSGMTLSGYPSATTADTTRWLGTQSTSISQNLPYTQGVFSVISRTVKGVTTALPSSIQLFLVNTNQPPTTNTTYALWNHSTYPNILRLGCAHTSGDYTGGLDGDIAEILFYNRELSTGERQELEGYLSWKWGLEDSLPAGHPYELSPPGLAFFVAHPVTGRRDYTGTNRVEIAQFPSVRGYNEYQIATTNEVGELNEGDWLPYDPDSPPDGQTCTFTVPETEGAVPLYGWLRDTTAAQPPLFAEGSIIYTTVAPTILVSNRVFHAMDGGTARGRWTDIDAGSTGGIFGGEPLGIFGIGITCPEDLTPGEPYVTLESGASYMVTLTVTNNAGNVAAATAEVTVTPALHIAPGGDDVNGDGTAGNPFKTVERALTAAADVAVVVVMAAGGTYSRTNEIILDRNMSLIASAGAAATRLSRDGSGGFHRIVRIEHPDALVQGFTIQNGSVTNGNGGGVAMTAGTLADCVVTNCSVTLSGAGGGGGGVYMSVGTVTNVLIDNNRVNNTNGVANGGGLYATGGRVLGSVLKRNETASDIDSRGGGLAMIGTVEVYGSTVVSNFVRSHTGFFQGVGGGVYMTGGLLADSFVARNEVRPSSSSLGGGIRMTGGVVTNSTIVNNQCYSHYAYAGGIYMTGGQVWDSTIGTNSASAGHVEEAGGVYMDAASALVDRCRILSNTASARGSSLLGGGGLSLRNGTVRNSLFYNNTAAGAHPGGGIYLRNGTVEHCTIADNSAVTSPGGGLCQEAGTVRNTIVYFNTGSPANVYKTGGTFTYSCTTPLVTSGSDVNNIEDDPDFVDRGVRDYRLRPGSLCLDAGTERIAYDLERTPRPLDGNGDSTAISDMGCFEFDPQGGPLQCSIAASETRGMNTLATVFTAAISGNTTGLLCWWDLGDGTVTNGAALTEVSHTYTSIGRYSVSLLVSNQLGETFSSVRNDWIWVVSDADVYVATNGPSVFPYHTLDTAATRIQDAVAAIETVLERGGVSRTIHVGPGTYALASEVYVARGVTIEGSGSGLTVLNGQNTWRGVNVAASATNTVLRGLTVRNGYTGLTGGGILLAAPESLVEDCVVTNSRSGSFGGGIIMTGADSVIRRCVIRNNQSGDSGGGVRMTTGTVIDCDIRQNYGNFHHARAGGISLEGGMVTHSTIVSNRITAVHTVGGAGILQNSGTVRNCLVEGNYEDGGYSFSGGGGIWLQSGGTVESCTIVNNYARENGLGLRQDTGTVINSIIYTNRGVNVAHMDTARNGGVFSYSCTTPLISGGANIENLNDNPGFRNPGVKDYRLTTISPPAGKGLVRDWMRVAGAVDLAGDARLPGSRVDMGCYQLPAIGTLILLR